MKNVGTRFFRTAAEPGAVWPSIVLRLLAVTMAVAPALLQSASPSETSKAPPFVGVTNRSLHPTPNVQEAFPPLTHHASLEFSPNGQWLATGSKDGTLRLWSATTGTLLAGPLGHHRDAIVSLHFSPGRGRLYA